MPGIVEKYKSKLNYEYAQRAQSGSPFACHSKMLCVWLAERNMATMPNNSRQLAFIQLKFDKEVGNM